MRLLGGEFLADFQEIRVSCDPFSKVIAHRLDTFLVNGLYFDNSMINYTLLRLDILT